MSVTRGPAGHITLRSPRRGVDEEKYPTVLQLSFPQGEDRVSNPSILSFGLTSGMQDTWIEDIERCLDYSTALKENKEDKYRKPFNAQPTHKKKKKSVDVGWYQLAPTPERTDLLRPTRTSLPPVPMFGTLGANNTGRTLWAASCTAKANHAVYVCSAFSSTDHHRRLADSCKSLQRLQLSAGSHTTGTSREEANAAKIQSPDLSFPSCFRAHPNSSLQNAKLLR